MTLITGSRGLAETLIAKLHEAGHRLSVLVRREEAATELRNRYCDVLVQVGDAIDRNAVRSWVQETIGRFGTIDNVINNAAITGPAGPLHEADIDEFANALDVNLLAPIYLIQQVVPVFLKKKRGVVLNLAGGGANAPRPFFSAYAVSKCAVVRLTENLAHEYPELRFYAVSPGALATPMMQGLAELDPTKVGREQVEAAERMKKGGEDPAKAAALALWLCQERPTHLNGCVISAIWDDYREAPERPAKLGWWRLRRVDEVCKKNLLHDDVENRAH